MPELDHRGPFAAVDWAKDAHAVSIVEESGAERLAEQFPNTEAGLRALTGALLEGGVERVAIERPDGLLVDRLLSAGLCVVAVHPNKLASARERHSASGKKSDGFDAFVLADLLRTDGHRFEALRPDAGPACPVAHPRGLGRGARGPGQPAARRARGLLAGGGGHLRGG